MNCSAFLFGGTVGGSARTEAKEQQSNNNKTSDLIMSKTVDG
jgi:hypothetical protein